ncbi:MAG: aminotransferase class V-fold PLP-dependent enzyme [Pirellula sp.]|nr:aminotransferase class V-fold PLP-dependent enzyme [Pirellula sp.]
MYLDSAATGLRPKAVVDAVLEAMVSKTGGVHRSVNYLGDRATEAYEESRLTVARWIGGLENEVVFTRNTTEALNLIAHGWPDRRRVLVSATDHHSSLLSWGDSRTTTIPPRIDGRVDEEAIYKELALRDVAVVCLSHVSNVTGQMPDIESIVERAHHHGAIVVLDAAQSAPHGPLETQSLGCDFLAFSGHKLGSPAGVGVLWGKPECLRRLEVVSKGGGILQSLRGGEIRYKDDPWRLEAGTPAIESVIGLAAAIDYLRGLDCEQVVEHLKCLRSYAIEKLSLLPRIRLLSANEQGAMGPVSFYFEGLPSHVIARGLSDSYGVCVRSGFQCAEPLHEFLGIGPSLRLSFFVYNQVSDIDFAIESIRSLVSLNAR